MPALILYLPDQWGRGVPTKPAEYGQTPLIQAKEQYCGISGELVASSLVFTFRYTF